MIEVSKREKNRGFVVNKFESIQRFPGFDSLIGNNPPIRDACTGMILFIAIGFPAEMHI